MLAKEINSSSSQKFKLKTFEDYLELEESLRDIPGTGRLLPLLIWLIRLKIHDVDAISCVCYRHKVLPREFSNLVARFNDTGKLEEEYSLKELFDCGVQEISKYWLKRQYLCDKKKPQGIGFDLDEQQTHTYVCGEISKSILKIF